MSAGLYELNGNISYTKDLDKKLKRKKGATIIQEYKGDDLENIESILQKMLNDYVKDNVSEDVEDSKELYVFYNNTTKETITSIYSTLEYLKNDLNIKEWTLKKSL